MSDVPPPAPPRDHHNGPHGPPAAAPLPHASPASVSANPYVPHGQGQTGAQGGSQSAQSLSHPPVPAGPPPASASAAAEITSSTSSAASIGSTASAALAQGSSHSQNHNNQGQGQSQGQRQGERGGRQQREIVAQPFNAALSHITPSVFDNAPSSAMAVVAIPISDDVSDEEVAREVLRKQMKKEQGALQYNKFGVLDEEDADNEA